MILPQNVVGNNRVRDAKIIEMYVEMGEPQTVVARKFKISQQRVAKILRQNSITIIENAKDWNKIKRLHSMNNMLLNDKLPDANNKLDVMKELRKELEGESALVTVNNVTQIVDYGKKDFGPGGEISATTPQVPARLPSEV